MLLNLVCISTQFLSYPLVLPDDVNHFTEADARHLGEKYQNNTHLHLLPTTDRHLQSVVLQQLRLVQPSVPLRQHQPAARHTAVCRYNAMVKKDMKKIMRKIMKKIMKTECQAEADLATA